MPPKRQSPIDVDQEKENSSLNQKDEKKPFKCYCNRTYGSLAAVHTHITNKHNRNPEQKKYFKSKIVNPKKNGEGPSASIRMKDISYHAIEAEMMSLADNTLKQIYDVHYGQNSNRKKDNILEDDDNEEFDEEDLDQLLSDEVQVQQKFKEELRQALELVSVKKRDKAISQLKKKKQLSLNLHNIEERQSLEFSSIKLKKFKLAMKKQLSKFFIPEIASKIQLSLEVIRKQQLGEAEWNFNDLHEKIWSQFPIKDIQKILENYYEKWVQLLHDGLRQLNANPIKDDKQ